MANEEKPQSQFNTRADNAALKLRQSLQQQGAQIPDTGTVEVGPDGKQPGPLPPEGSYIRQAIERQRAERAAQEQGQPSREQQLGDQPPAGTSEQAIDGSQAPPLPDGQPPQESPAEPSPNAQRRIAELVAELRQKDQDLQQALVTSKEKEQSFAELEAKLISLQQQHEQMLQANLENLDPETRMAVMQDARIKEYIAMSERRIMDQIMPHLQGLQQQSVHQEMMQLSKKYPRFDIQIHGPLIDMFRGKNPHCTVEMAYRAVAADDELMIRDSAGATAVPPIVPPGSGPPTPRYMPEPTSQSDPEKELVEEAQMFKKLMASDNPEDHKRGQAGVLEHLKRRLF